MSMHSSNVVGEFVQPREGPKSCTTFEASFSAASVGSSTTMLRLDVTLEFKFPSKKTFMVAPRKVALQGCGFVAFQAAKILRQAAIDAGIRPFVSVWLFF